MNGVTQRQPNVWVNTLCKEWIRGNHVRKITTNRQQPNNVAVFFWLPKLTRPTLNCTLKGSVSRIQGHTSTERFGWSWLSCNNRSSCSSILDCNITTSRGFINHSSFN